MSVIFSMVGGLYCVEFELYVGDLVVKGRSSSLPCCCLGVVVLSSGRTRLLIHSSGVEGGEFFGWHAKNCNPGAIV